MRARAIQRRALSRVGAAAAVRRPSVVALVFLRGRDADGRLRELVAQRTRARPLLGALAAALVSRRAFEPLGFRSLGDWSRERIGVDARAVRQWSRVSRALAELPRLREAVCSGEVSWTVARRIVGVVTPETEAACLSTVRGRTVRAVETLLRAVTPDAEPEPDADEEDRVAVRVACSQRVSAKWAAALELARRVAGEALPAWECAEAIAAECASALGATEPPTSRQGTPARSGLAPQREKESGLRDVVWPHLAWHPRPSRRPDLLARLTHGLDRSSPRALDRRFRTAIAFLQQVDFEIGRVLRQVVDRKLYRELGFESFERYVTERLDLSPRTARAPEVATAFREGRITQLQAEVLLHGGRVERAEAVTLRRLEDEVLPREVAFWAPSAVATLFEGLVARVGLEAMLDHAIATWLTAGEAFEDYADFERDGWRCTVPGCTARRNLQSHHIVFRSAGGPDVPGNRTTLCAFHHHRGVHAGTVGIRGRAPADLTYTLGVGRFRSHDVLLS
jgi:hypothetical protein